MCAYAEYRREGLSGHLTTLEAANIVVIMKGFVGKRPQTWVTLTDHGRYVVQNYWKQMGSWGARVGNSGTGSPATHTTTRGQHEWTR